MITIIIPVYNRKETIRRAIDSVLNQTYSDFELLIIDDGSTDKTEDVVRSYSDERIKYIKSEVRSGANHARNIGIRNANGELIAFNDSDDEWHSDKLTKQVALLKETGADMVFCAMNISGSKPSRIKSGWYTQKQLLIDGIVGTPTILVKSDIAKHIMFDETMPRLQDWDFAIRVSQIGKIYYMDEQLINVYRQEGSISTSNLNGVKAVKMIIDKNKEIIESDPAIKSAMWYLYGSMLEAANTPSIDPFLTSLKSKPSMKALIKLCRVFSKVI